MVDKALCPVLSCREEDASVPKVELSAASRVAGSRRVGENGAVLQVSEVLSAPRVAGTLRLAENVAVLEVSEVAAAPRARGNDDGLALRPLRRRGRVSATAGESERIIGLPEFDFSTLEPHCTFSHHSRIHGESSRVFVGPFSCFADGVSASASVRGARSTCRALLASVVP